MFLPEVRGLHRRIGAHLGRWTLGQLLPLVHHDHVVRQLHHQIDIVFDEHGDFASKCNTAMVALEPVLSSQQQQEKVDEAIWHLGETDEFLLRDLVEKHFRYTGSLRARMILDNWVGMRTRFVKVFPHEYKRALKQLHEAQRAVLPQKLAAE